MANGNCGSCGEPIDEEAIQMKAKVSAKLFPGVPAKPPKLCSKCVWTGLSEFLLEERTPPLASGDGS